MEFRSSWITTKDFADLKPVNIFHREKETPAEEPGEIKNYHTHFRRKFILNDVEDIYINITADDYYKLYINGEFVCQGPAPAYPSNYKYNRVDITQYLRKGENIIACHVYYQGLVNRVWVSGDNRQGMIADIYKGNDFLLGTDAEWKYSVAKEFGGDAVGYETAFLENIDFSLEEKGWTELDFNDSNYLGVVCKKCADYRFSDLLVPAVCVYKKRPQTVEKTGAGRYFIDFGEKISGQFYMSVKGIKGQKVRILCGEETIKENPKEVRHDMRCNCNYDETCILSGLQDNFNFYDYKAFRYVNVISSEDNINPDSFSVIVRHHKFEEKCFLKTELPYLKDIWRICSNALKYSAQEALVDCPSREKGVYLGDFTVSGLAHLYLTGDSQYYKKTLFDFAETANVCSGIMAVANCALMQEIADYSLLYPTQILNYFKVTKDIETVKKLYPTACGIVDWFAAYARRDGLIENVKSKWNMVDWPMNLRDDYSAEISRDAKRIDCHNVLNAYYIGAIDAMNEICDVLGFEAKKNVSKLKEAFIKAFYNPKTRLFCDNEKQTCSSLHSNVLPIFFDIADSSMYEDLRKFIMQKGLCCGVWFANFVLKGLAKIGAYEDELKLLLNESEHSWVNMLREGATASFEAWGKEQKWNTSLCHPWASAPIIALVEDLDGKFGINIVEN